MVDKSGRRRTQQRITLMTEFDTDGRRILWELVRADYEAGTRTLNTVARRHRLPRAMIEERARLGRWSRPDGEKTDRHILIHKLQALLERQIDAMDENMRGDGKQEAAVLSSLVRDLERLIGIEKAESGRQANGVTREMRDIQKKLEDRINAITKG